jgi:hypothetical protein
MVAASSLGSGDHDYGYVGLVRLLIVAIQQAPADSGKG